MRGFEIIGPFSIRVNATPTFPYESDSITRVIVSRDDPHSGEEISSEHYPSHSSSGAERRENKRLREDVSHDKLAQIHNEHQLHAETQSLLEMNIVSMMVAGHRNIHHLNETVTRGQGYELTKQVLEASWNNSTSRPPDHDH